jgi:WD40 repeat protein
MRGFRLSCVAVTLALVTVVSGSCKDSTAPNGGTLKVIVVSTGADIDADGYRVSVDGGEPLAVASADTISISGLDASPHAVVLTGMATNCAVAENPVVATVAAGATMITFFPVVCVERVGSITLQTLTTGDDISAQPYGTRLDGYQSSIINPSSTVEVTGVREGSHDVTLTSVPANCTVLGANPRQVTVVYGESSPIAFAVFCARRNGELRIVVATNGIDLDPDGYSLKVDALPAYVVASSSTTMVPGVHEGLHTITLSGVADNCTVGAPHPRPVTAVYNATVSEAILVTCVTKAGAMRVTAHTTGADFDPNGYRLIVDNLPVRAIDVNGTQLFPDLATGVSHSLFVYDIARNCTLDVPASQTGLIVPVRDTLVINLGFQCVQGGTMQISAATSGVEVDASGYRAHLVGQGLDTLASVSSNGTVAIGTLTPGDYQVTLTDVAGNCDISGGGLRTSTVAAGATVTVAFAVQCSASSTLAYVSYADGNDEIYTIKTSGVGAVRLTNNPSVDLEPDWSPNGAKIVFRSNRDGNSEIYVMNADGSAQNRLTNNAASDEQPVWSPDGTRIAFVSSRSGNPDIYLMNADGQNVVRLTNHARMDADPAWSPDGSRIAFTSQRDGNSEIYVMNADGSNVVRITFNETEDHQPAWSPDGNSIAFVRTTCTAYGCGGHQIFTISPTGTGLKQATTGGYDDTPSWSPDSRKIAYARYYCDAYDYYYQYCYTTITIVTVDSGASADVTPGYEYDPAWRR